MLSFISKGYTKVGEPLSPKEQSVISLLINEVGGYEKARDPKYVHASDLTKDHFCPRAVALHRIVNKPLKSSYVSAALRATFDVGNATADLVANQWLRGKAWGTWVCTRCFHVQGFTKLNPLAPKMGSTTACASLGCSYKYQEVKFGSLVMKVSGSLDLVLDLGRPKLTIVELKIMNTKDFDALVAPLAEHRLRTNLYMKIVEESGQAEKYGIDVKLAKVLYVSRGFGKKNDKHAGEILPFKEFDVHRNDVDLEPYVKKAKQLIAWEENKSVLPVKICKHGADGPAKLCGVAGECWSGKYV